MDKNAMGKEHRGCVDAEKPHDVRLIEQGYGFIEQREVKDMDFRTQEDFDPTAAATYDTTTRKVPVRKTEYGYRGVFDDEDGEKIVPLEQLSLTR